MRVREDCWFRAVMMMWRKKHKDHKKLAAVSVICEMGEEQPEDFGRNRLKRCDE